MKKVLSVGLALAMMTSTAFASALSPKNILPGAEVKINFRDFSDPNSLYIGGKSVDAGKLIGEADGVIGDDIITSSFSISTVRSDKNNVSVDYYNATANTGNRKLGVKWAGNSLYNGEANDPNEGNDTGTGTGFGLNLVPADFPDVDKSTEADIKNAKMAIDRLARQDIQPYDFTSQNFTATIKASKGQDLVKGLSFDGAGNLIVTFKDDYRLPSTNGAPDFVVTELSVQSIKDIKSPTGMETVLYSGRKFIADVKTAGEGVFNNEDTTKPVTVGISATEVQLVSGTEHIMSGDGTWEKFTSEGVYSATTKYNSNNLTVTGTVYNGDVTSFKLDTEISKPVVSLLQNNPNANVEVYPIVAKGFKVGFTVSIRPTMLAGASADENGNVEVLSAVAFNNKKIYTVNNAGALSLAAFTYNAATGAWEGRIPATGATILVSDVPLVGVTAATTTTPIVNPGTGFAVDVAAAIVK